MKIGVWFCAPNRHAQEGLDSLRWSLRETLTDLTGETPPYWDYTYSPPDPYIADMWIIVGGHVLPDTVHTTFESGYRCVFFNTEHHASRWLRPDSTYLKRLQDAYAVIDYGDNNLSKVLAKAPHVVVPRPHQSQLQNLRPDPIERPIDVLFVGSPNERRDAVMRKLQLDGLACVYGFNIYGDKLTELVRNSKVCLNMHYYMPPVQEAVRLLDYKIRGAHIIDETDFDYCAGDSTKSPVGELITAVHRAVENGFRRTIVGPTMHAQLLQALREYL